MILGFGDTIGCSFINGSGVYVGYPGDVTEGKVVIGNTGPYAMPPLHGCREFRRATADNNTVKTLHCSWHCGRLWCIFIDAGTGRHLWSGEMVENRERNTEVEYWRWNTMSKFEVSSIQHMH